MVTLNSKLPLAFISWMLHLWMPIVSHADSRIAEVIPAMGTQAKIIAYADQEAVGKQAVEAGLARILEIEDRLSDYDSKSEAMLFCDSAPHSEFQPISRDLWICLLRGKAIWEHSNGAFDVTVGAYSRLWRRSRRQKEFPSDSRLSAAKLVVGFEHVHVDDNKPLAKIDVSGLLLDFGAIAKGYAADSAIRVLKEHGVERAIVDVGGDVAIGVPAINEPGWPVGIAPLSEEGKLQVAKLSNCGVATSGDAFQFVELNGRRYSHIIDPRTGIALTLRSSVTVVAPSGLQADAWASAISVLGPRAGLRAIRKIEGVEAYIVTDRNEDGSGEISQSRGFPKLADVMED